MARKYKGFLIETQYLHDVKPDPKSPSGEWKTVNVGIDHYRILDPMENDGFMWAEATIEECKASIDSFLAKVGMKDNKPSSWEKLENDNEKSN